MGKLELHDYTKGEERFNMISHIAGAGMGFVTLVACAVIAAYHHNITGIVTGIIYGLTIIVLFTISSVYHGLPVSLPKKVLRVLDYCAIYLLIAGTYTPVVLSSFREAYPVDAWIMFGAIWGLAVLGITLTAIDRKRFIVFAIICYLSMGWMVVFRLNRVIEVLGVPFITLMLAGGSLYTLGVIFYAVGKHKKYMHSVFHLFVNVASILHSIAIAAFVMPI